MSAKTNENKTSEPKRRGKGRWLILLFASIFAAVLTVFGFARAVADRAREVMRASGYVEEWTEGVDGETVESIAYGDEEWQKLDAYFPKELAAEKSRGALVYVHGGAWVGGKRGDMRGFARRATKAGYVSASVEYLLFKRGENESRYSIFAVLDELDAALAKLKETASERGIELDRVALAGDSAGGHIISLYAYSRGKSAPLPVVFIAPRVAPIDFHVDAWDPVQPPRSVELLVRFMNRDHRETPLELIKKPDAETEKLINGISPLAHLTPESAIPTVSAYGGKDPLVGTKHCAKLAQKFAELGAKPLAEVTPEDETSIVFDLVEHPNSGHMLEKDPERAERFRELTFEYARRYLEEPAR